MEVHGTYNCTYAPLKCPNMVTSTAVSSACTSLQGVLRVLDVAHQLLILANVSGRPCPNIEGVDILGLELEVSGWG